MADEDFQEGEPKKPAKKKAAAPPADAKKKKPVAADDDDEDIDVKKKSKKPAKSEGSDLGSSPLSAIIPVGGSIFALLSLWLSVLSGLMALAGLILFTKELISILLPSLWPIAFLCGVLSFFTHKHKASYGSVAGNMRAIIGILISLVVMGLHALLLFLYFTGGR